MAAKTRDDVSAVTKIDPVPFTLPDKPVRECRFALVTSAGIRLRTDPSFDVERLSSQRSRPAAPSTWSPQS